MLHADKARVAWDGHRKCWEVHIQVGAEVVKRPLPRQANKSVEPADNELIAQAVAIAKEEGYQLDPTQVEIVAKR